MTIEDALNTLILGKDVDTNKISDGYHTFGELYEHRILLWITLCRLYSTLKGQGATVWRSKAHSDGTSIDGWFLLGVNQTKGIQITYHLPESKWNECHFAEKLDKAPDWDGHTSADVIDRLKML